MRLAAHKLKPSIDMLEILSLKQVIRDIEINSQNREQLDQVEIWIQILEKTIND